MQHTRDTRRSRAATNGYEFPGVPQAIMDMVVLNGGALPRCLA
ncbi:hypothetical protein [Candidatus Poriferisodalis sp.]